MGRDAGADSLPGAGYRTHSRMAACCGRTHPADEKAGTTASASQVRETNSGKQKKWLPLFCLLLSKIIMIIIHYFICKSVLSVFSEGSEMGVGHVVSATDKSSLFPA